MEVRDARREDEGAIRQLIALFPRELVQDELPDALAFVVAYEGNELLGCGAIDIYNKKIAEIRSLAVRKEWQGKGVARALIERCVARAQERGVHQVLAITGSLEFFEKLGFRTFNQEKYAVFKYLR